MIDNMLVPSHIYLSLLLTNMYRINLQIITTPNFIDSAYITKMVDAANVVLKANQVEFWLDFNPNTDYRQEANLLLNSDDGSTQTIDPNGYVLTEGEKARYHMAKDYPDKLVFFARQGFGGTSGGHSWFEMENHVFFYLNQNDPFNGQVGSFLHELGHHLHLFHTFASSNVYLTDEERKNRTYQQCLDEIKHRLADLIKNYVEGENKSKEKGLQAFDGDGLTDTAPDPGNDIITYSNAVAANMGTDSAATMNADFGSGKLNVCGGVTSASIPVTFTDGSKKTYTLTPDKTNIMSYYQACDNAKTISLMQRTKMLNTMVMENRNYLLHMCGIKWPSNKIYFFKGPQYIRYDIGTKSVEPGYPKPTKTFWANWPSNWDSPDAAFLWPGQKTATFIRGIECIDYDVASNAFLQTPKPVVQRFLGWPVEWIYIDAALVLSHVVYFFKGAEFIVYSFVDGKITDKPKLIVDQFDFYWTSDFDCIVGSDTVNQVNVFKGSRYIVYDLSTKKRISDMPTPIRGNWPGVTKNFTSAFAGWDGRFNFCKGTNMAPFDTVLNDTSGKLQPIANLHLPSSWTSLDAELILNASTGANNNPPAAKIAVFYYKDEAVLYNITESKSYTGDKALKIKEFYPDWPSTIPPRVLATLKWPDGKAFLFVTNGNEIQYLVYDTKFGSLNKLDAKPKSVTDFFKNWPTALTWKQTIKTVLANWREGDKGIIYFFSNDEFIKYDVVTSTVLPGYPRKIEGSDWKSIDWRPATNFDNLT